MKRTEPGSLPFDYRPGLTVLKKAGYCGWLTVESKASDNSDAALERAFRIRSASMAGSLTPANGNYPDSNPNILTHCGHLRRNGARQRLRLRVRRGVAMRRALDVFDRSSAP